MNFPDAQSLSQSYDTTHWLIKKHTDGVDHAGSLVQPPFAGNCLNWVLGHILAGRNEALSYMGGTPVWDEETLARYKTGSPPIIRGEQALSLEQLLSDLDESQKRIVATLAELPPEELGRVVETRFGDRPAGQHLGGLHWHETYHTGQLELLREIALAG